MKYIKEQLAKFKKRFNIKLSDTAISLLGIGILIVVLIGGMVLYNASQKQPLFSFFGRDIFGEDVFDVFDDDEDEEEEDKDKDKNTEDEDQNTESENQEQEKEEDSSNSSNGDIQFKEEDKTDDKQEDGSGGLTPSEDDKDSSDEDEEDGEKNWSMFI